MKRSLVVLFAVVMAGCGGTDPAPVDAGSSDAGASDSGTGDAGCEPGSVVECYSLDAGTPGVGRCAFGTDSCGLDRNYSGACIGDQGPLNELCNGLDDDCDGVVDDDQPQQSCGVGACANSEPSCVNGALHTCTPHAATAESCNGVDDDCDGVVDNGDPDGGAACTTAELGACAAGAIHCAAGVLGCQRVSAPTAELCDGLDNDCDGVVDNGNPGGGVSCTSPQPGVCAAGTTACSNGVVVCQPNAQASTELCDSLDNDCDGTVDNGNPGGGVSCTTGLLGACAAGSTACSNGVVVCNQNAQPSTESCDGVDNNCNGTADEGNPGGGSACNTGSLGVCAAGTSACSNGGLVCNQNVQPSAESCDGKDNNCNGTVDEGNPGGGSACATGLPGVCVPGTRACSNGNLICNQNAQPSAEVCDGVDNNCNGQVDEGNPGGGATCNTGKLGVCIPGTTACTGGALTCNQNVQPSAEICDGFDNNCNGTVDDGNPGGGTTCNTGKFGRCALGTTACTAGALTCNQNQQPVTEVCNGLDDDCNGTSDNGDPGGGAVCPTGKPLCPAGTIHCISPGTLTCVAPC